MSKAKHFTIRKEDDLSYNYLSGTSLGPPCLVHLCATCKHHLHLDKCADGSEWHYCPRCDERMEMVDSSCREGTA
jgi:predicted RNA-binding Zn-ribbon protein involved in translation (DUF1610 family)